MSREAPWFKFYAARWLGDRNIRYMTPEQRGYTIQLWCEAWESDPAGTLPEDPAILWRLAGAPSRKRFEKVSAPMLAQFELRDGRYFQAELIEQHEGLAAIHESRTRAALKGAQARWRNRDAMPSALPNAQQTHGSGNANQNREEREEKRLEDIPGARRWEIEQGNLPKFQDSGLISNLRLEKPGCSRCAGSGRRASYYSPGRQVPCECAGSG
jgi:uncharacterized protein YdaU (DUF1376 family)